MGWYRPRPSFSSSSSKSWATLLFLQLEEEEDEEDEDELRWTFNQPRPPLPPAFHALRSALNYPSLRANVRGYP